MTDNYTTVALREDTYETFEEAQMKRFSTTKMANTEAFNVILQEYVELQGESDD